MASAYLTYISSLMKRSFPTFDNEISEFNLPEAFLDKLVLRNMVNSYMSGFLQSILRIIDLLFLNSNDD